MLGPVLALEREAGTPGAEAARGLVAAHLEALGYRVSVQRFRFHPSSVLAFAIFGAGLGFLALVLLPLLTAAAVPRWAALAVWSGGVAAVALLASGVGVGWLSLGESREDANLLARRGNAPVTRWLVAHLDTKAQQQSMAGRLVAVWVVAGAVILLTILAAARLAGPVPLPFAAVGAALAIVAGSLAGRGRLRGGTRGARDNGSGLAAVLAAAAATSDPGTGILITGAEEFGLVGSRVFAHLEGSRLAGVAVVNFDTIDQEGDLYLVSHNRHGAELVAALAAGLGGLGPRVRPSKLPAGILVDSLPFARAGARAVTIGRLTWRTLGIIHTPQDVPEGLSLELAERVGRAVAAN